MISPDRARAHRRSAVAPFRLHRRHMLLLALLAPFLPYLLGSSCGSVDISDGGKVVEPIPGLQRFQRWTAVPVPGATVNAAGTNVLIQRTDLSIDTYLGSYEIGAAWNSASGSWLWTFDITYDGETFLDPTGALIPVTGVADGDQIAGTVWMKLGPDAIRSVGGLVHEFGSDGRLVAMHWRSGDYPRLQFVSEQIAGVSHTTEIEQCRSAGDCSAVFSIAYDSEGRIDTITDRAGRQARFTYNQDGLLETARDALDLAKGWPGFRYQYADNEDFGWLLFSIKNSEGEETTFAYPQSNCLPNPDCVKGPFVNRVTEVGDDRSRIHRFERSMLNPNATTKYIDPAGNVTRFVFDESHRLLEHIVPTGESTTLTWQGFEVASRTEPDGTQTTYEWINNFDEILRTDPSGNMAHIDFRIAPGENRAEPFARPLDWIEDDFGQVTRRKYDHDIGRLLWVENGELERTSFTYDSDNMPETVTLPHGDTMTLSAYGEHGHPTEVTIGGETQSLLYDAVGNYVGSEGANLYDLEKGGVIARSYDGDRNLASLSLAATDAQGVAQSPATVGIEYRSDGRPLAIHRPGGGDHVFEYDDFGQLVARRERVDGVWRETTFEYDEAGRRTAVELPNGMRRETTYDPSGRVKTRTAKRDGVVEATATLAYFDGRLVSFDDSTTGIETYEYDAAGRVDRIVFPGGEALELGYDLRSRKTDEIYEHADGSVLRSLGFDHDLADRETEVWDDGLLAIERHYDDGQKEETRYGNGLVRTHFYTDPGRLTYTSMVGPGGETVETTDVDLETFASPARVELAALTTAQHAGGPVASDERYSLGPVDDGAPDQSAGKRVFAWDDGLSPRSYAHDALGNLIQSPGRTHLYNAESNRLERIEETGSGALVADYGYDAAGYVTQRSGEAITWNAFGRPTAVGSSVLEWDLQGRLIRLTTPETDSRFAWGGRVETDAAGSPTRLDLGELLVQLDTGERLYRHLDFRGNVKLVSDGQGALVAHFHYTPYGIESLVGSSEQLSTFAGGRVIGDLVLLGVRLHDPQAGRFLSPDPVFQLQSQYVYARGNPVTFWDPGGLDPTPSFTPLDAYYTAAAWAGAAVGSAIFTPAIGIPVGILLGVGVAEFTYQVVTPNRERGVDSTSAFKAALQIVEARDRKSKDGRGGDGARSGRSGSIGSGLGSIGNASLPSILGSFGSPGSVDSRTRGGPPRPQDGMPGPDGSVINLNSSTSFRISF